MLEIALLLAAAAVFAIGGLAMKLSVGLTKPIPTAALFLLFPTGAALQAIAMRRAELGTAYIFVLGAEAVFATLLSFYVLGESLSPSRVAAIAVVVLGIAWLRST